MANKSSSAIYRLAAARCGGGSEAEFANLFSHGFSIPHLQLSVHRRLGGPSDAVYELVWRCRGAVQQSMMSRQRQVFHGAFSEAQGTYKELLATRRSLATGVLGLERLNAAQATAATKRLQQLGEQKEQLERQLAAAVARIQAAVRGGQSQC